jgi:tetratricopeptide (TPR) repeat protein
VTVPNDDVRTSLRIRGLPIMNSIARSFAGRRGTGGGRRKSRAPIAITAAVSVLVVAAALALLIGGGKASTDESAKTYPKKEILAAWSSGEKLAALEMARSSLELNPVDPFYLSFEGIAAYYLSMDKPEGDEKQALLDESVGALRKAIASGGKLPVKAQVEYVLGKAYYQKGQPWFDLATKYLAAAKASGYEGKDSDQYLGLCFAGMQNHGEAVKHFEDALQTAPSDVLMLSAAISYKELGDTAKTESLLSKVVAAAADALLVQRARFILGEMAMAGGDFSKASAIYQSVVDTDPRSAEGWYRLGLVAEAQSDPIRARADWRKATLIDPSHVEARKKLAERL